MSLRRFLITVTAFLLVALTLTLWFFPSNDDFYVENPFWNGISDTVAEHRIQPLDSLFSLPSLPEGATFITLPYVEYTDEELEQLDIFISRGGRMVLADDYGYGNQVLQYLELAVRFDNQALLDPVFNYKNEQFPLINRLEPDPLTENITGLAFNHATCLTGVTEGEILALSSSFSFLDFNDNEQYDSTEPKGPLPVISRHELGNGELVLISDPSIFINGMTGIADNAVFIQNIVATAIASYIDQAHLIPSDLSDTKNLLQQARDTLKTVPGTLTLATVVVAAALIPLWYRKKREISNAE